MKWRVLLPCLAFLVISAVPAKADTRIIVRTNLGSQLLSDLCLLQGCTVAQTLDGLVGDLFLVTAPDIINPTLLLNILRATPGILDAELDQLVNLVGGLNQVTTIPAGLTDSVAVNYHGSVVWHGYVAQPAAGIVQLSSAQTTYQFFGSGTIADIDTGVDPTHPVLTSVLLQGYDFTRNQPGGSELTDFTQPIPTNISPQPVQVNHYTAAMVDSPTASLLNGNVQYSAFGHGTMVMGILHLVAPEAKLLPLKAFGSNGSANLSDIIRAIYYAVENNANVINMSFDLTSNSTELTTALSYATASNVVCAASAGNDGKQELVYPAAISGSVMGTASTSDSNTRSSFSNFGSGVVWVAAPGEAIITTFPFATYAAGWGTSFSSPFVSGTASLLQNSQSSLNQIGASGAIAHATALTSDLGNGLLNIPQALQSLATSALSPQVALGGTRVDFGNQQVGIASGSQMISLTNSGTGPLTISSIALTAPNQGDFLESDTCTTTLNAGASCNMVLSFKPTTFGLRSASLTIADNAPGSPHSATLTGVGLAPQVSLSAPSLAYSGQLVTTSSTTQNISITNTGNSTLNFTSIGLSGANSSDFSLTNGCSSTLTNALACTLTATFKPTAVGTRSASLTIVDDSAGSPHTISLSGTGTDFNVSSAIGGSTTATVTAGQTASYSLQLGSLAGFSGSVSVTCAGSPNASTCTAVPSTIVLDGTNPGPVTLNVSTTARSQAGLLQSPNPGTPDPRVWLLLSAGLAWLLLFLLGWKVQPSVRRRFALVTPLAVAAILFCHACSGGSYSQPPQQQGTTAGTYTLTVIATSGGVSHNKTVTLTVN